MKPILSILALLPALMMLGCTTPAKRDPAFAAVRPMPVQTEENYDGAIFDSRTNMSLFEDYRAHRVGDILTVTLDETTNGKKQTKTTISKDSSNSITNPTVFGSTPQFNLPSQLPLASTKNNDLSFDLSSSSSLDGKGDSEQKNNLSGNITVSVVEVLPNGNLVIRGEKVVTINQGNEYLRLSGMVSPRDIDTDNTISSIKVADAQISYVGDGETNDANAMGWLSRFFISALMPF